MLGRSLGALHALAAAVAASSASAELPADFAETMARWMVSANASRSPLAVRSPEAPADLCNAAAALAGTQERSGCRTSLISVADGGQGSQPVGLDNFHAARLWM